MTKKGKRIVGIDYGLKRLGIAISDERKIIASPLTTLVAESKLQHTVDKFLKELVKIEKEWNCLIEEIVVGLPLHMNGRVGVLADEVKHFVTLLQEQASYPVVTWDERLTTLQAERSLRESSMTRKKRAQKVDVVAAIIILQSYLDYKGGGPKWT